MAAPIKFGVGQSVLRKEDDALIRGKGRYTDDHSPQPALHALMLRSPHAHATFTIDVAKAPRRCPASPLILTAADVADLGGLPCLFNLPDNPFTAPPYPILAKDEVRHVGDAVAFVVADTVDAGPRRGRGDRGRMDAAAGGGRRRQCGQAGRAAGLARSSRQRAVRRADRRQEGGRCGLREGACGGRDHASSIRASSPTTWRRARRSPNTTPSAIT